MREGTITFVKTKRKMNLEFVDISANTSKPKATIHITGKLGFNSEAVKYMEINEITYFRIALNRDAKQEKNLYFVAATQEDNGAVKIAKSGQYFYLNLGTLFNQMGLEYEKYTIAFDIIKGEHEGRPLFTLRKRRKETLRERKSEDPLQTE